MSLNNFGILRAITIRKEMILTQCNTIETNVSNSVSILLLACSHFTKPSKITPQNKDIFVAVLACWSVICIIILLNLSKCRI